METPDALSQVIIIHSITKVDKIGRNAKVTSVFSVKKAPEEVSEAKGSPILNLSLRMSL